MPVPGRPRQGLGVGEVRPGRIALDEAGEEKREQGDEGREVGRDAPSDSRPDADGLSPASQALRRRGRPQAMRQDIHSVNALPSSGSTTRLRRVRVDAHHTVRRRATTPSLKDALIWSFFISQGRETVRKTDPYD